MRKNLISERVYLVNSNVNYIFDEASQKEAIEDYLFPDMRLLGQTVNERCYVDRNNKASHFFNENYSNPTIKNPKMKQLKLLIAFILLVQLGFSQCTSKSNNYKGWRELTWESTEDDVKQKYGSQITILPTPEKYGENDEWYCPFEIHNYDLGYDTFNVSFLFDGKTKKLSQVNVEKEDPIDIKRTVQDLEVSLTEKYGRPIVKEDTPKYISKWSFPELSITLDYFDFKHKDV